MTKIVLDSSAILAVVHGERGSEVVAEWIPEVAVSAVNICEVVTRLLDRGMTDGQISRTVSDLSLQIVPFELEQAFTAGLMRRSTRHAGLSLGDRACLALANRLGLPALTADRAWADLDVGVDVRLIRS